MTKQITLGLATVLGLWTSAVLAYGEIAFIDTIELWDESVWLYWLVVILYFIAFLVIGVMSKKKGYKALQYTTVISGAIPSFLLLFGLIVSFFEDAGKLGESLEELYSGVAFLLYPFITVSYPFGANLVASILFISAPMVAVIAYKVTKQKVIDS